MTLRSMSLAAAAVGLVALIVAAWIGSRRQQNTLSATQDRLVRARTPPEATTRFNRVGLSGLPAPVERYLRWAVPTEKLIREVRLKQIGTLRTDVHSGRWMRFEAEHIVVPPATGFVWNARVAVAPLLHVRVRDALIEGRGSGHVTLMSAFTVAADADTPEMNSGSLHRYLAEAVWYPTALLPGPKLSWTAIDASRALATLTDLGISVSLEFRFADSGEVTGIFTPARWGKFGDDYRQAGWEGHFLNYEHRDGAFVPTYGEVGWYIDGAWKAVWKGTVTSVELHTAD